MLSWSASRACLLAMTFVFVSLGEGASAQEDDAKAPGRQSQIAATDTAAVEFFESKVRPLLAARCHECHGAGKQKGNLRLDSLAAVFKGGDTAPAVVPLMPDESLLVDAIRYGETYQMPPKSQLPPEEIAILVEWVRQGAVWGRDAAASGGDNSSSVFDLESRSRHWSFQPLAAVPPPEVGNSAWVRTPVDRFILARLEAAGLTPSPAADRRTLLRRVTYDLIGLPPSPADIEAFLADDSPTAYEKVVDRLLASPHYGERWARHWLDLVRYAETYGHEFDYEMPNAYRYRDYVIRAFNSDVPYDTFVIEHIAGDLLPTPRRHPQEGFNESILGTGCFFFGEAKHSPVDVRQDEADRIDNQIDVFAKTFLGLTVSCARCHDHKFDPISTRDYYALAGYLQSSRYQQAFIDSPQVLAEPIARLRALRDEQRQAVTAYSRVALDPQLARLADAMLASGQSGSAEAWAKYLDETALAHVDDVFYPWAVLMRQQRDGAAEDFAQRRAKLADELTERRDRNAGGRWQTFADFSGSSYEPWQTTGAAFGDGPLAGTSVDAGDLGRLEGASVAHSGAISPKLQGALRSPTFEITMPWIQYRLHGTGGQVRLIVDGLQLIQNPIYGGLKIEVRSPEPHWHQQDVSKWIGHRAYIEVIDDGDGYLALDEVAFADGATPAEKPNKLILELLEDPTVTSAAQLAQKYQSCFQQVLRAWLAEPNQADTDAADRAAIIEWLLRQKLLVGEIPGPQAAALRDTLAAIDQKRQEIERGIGPPRLAMALAEGTAENERVFIRGSHKTLGEEVPRRFLEVLGGTRHAAPPQGSGRLQLAAQVVSPANPLLPRVMVNRLWHHHFGAGLVRSPDDFGAMGQPPTHPELLDFLASRFAAEGWSVKQMHRLMLLSNTYRMSSQSRIDADRVDPENKLWHRMAVRRLEAECIRDAILAVSGRTDARQHGPSVMPHLTPFMTGRGRPTTSGPLDGDGRRSIYLAVRRNFLSPMFLAFDYPIPFTTIGRRSVSNVPAQALAMMNNPFVRQQAELWAARVSLGPERSPAERVREMFVTALGRPPDDAEQPAALTFLSEVADGAGDSRGWADLAHVLLNLKEFIFIP
jgi:mono/diheme cytochrome c family protein